MRALAKPDGPGQVEPDRGRFLECLDHDESIGVIVLDQEDSQFHWIHEPHPNESARPIRLRQAD